VQLETAHGSRRNAVATPCGKLDEAPLGTPGSNYFELFELLWKAYPVSRAGRDLYAEEGPENTQL